MSEGERWIIVCQDAKDGSGDVIIDLPPELLSRMGIGIGDDLAISVVNGVIELRPVHGIGAMSVRPVLAGAMRDGFYHAYRVLLEASLQIPTNASDLDIHDMIDAGLSANLIKSLCDVGTISPIERDGIISLEALEAKLVGNLPLSVDESDRLFRVVHVNTMAEVIFGDAVKSRHWLSTPKSRFSGKSPNAILSTTPGTHQVEEMLMQVAEGMSY